MLETIPAAEELSTLVGTSLYEVWKKLCALIEENYDADRLWNKGGKAWKYEYKYRRGGKTLCALYAKDDRIGFMVVFGKEEQRKFETERTLFSKGIQEIYDAAKTYRDGKWIMIEPTDASSFDDFKRLLKIKRKPNKKQ